MIWRSGPDMGCTFFSDSWLEFTGRSIDEELGFGWASGVHPADRARCVAAYESAFAARREFQLKYRLRRHDGEYRWILDIGTPDWDEDGRFIGYVGSCVDITRAQRRQVGLASVRAGEAPPRPHSDPAAVLTRREREVVALLARGLSNRQIADELVISVATVRVHVDHIFAKLDMHSRAQVAAWSIRNQTRLSSLRSGLRRGRDRRGSGRPSDSTVTAWSRTSLAATWRTSRRQTAD